MEYSVHRPNRASPTSKRVATVGVLARASDDQATFYSQGETCSEYTLSDPPHIACYGRNNSAQYLCTNEVVTPSSSRCASIMPRYCPSRGTRCAASYILALFLPHVTTLLMLASRKTVLGNIAAHEIGERPSVLRPRSFKTTRRRRSHECNKSTL